MLPRYKKTKYNDSEDQMKKYTLLMSAYGAPVGIDFKFRGMVANTLDAHRLIQHYQEERGPEVADKIVNCKSRHIIIYLLGIPPNAFPDHKPKESSYHRAYHLTALYEQYFTQEKHPSSPETLLKAAADAGVEKADAETVIRDEYQALQDTKMLIQEQRGNGIDAVPYVVLEGKRRDFTLEGAKEVDDYLKEMEKLVKETK